MKKFNRQEEYRLLDPKNDVAFKHVFGNKDYPNISISLINAVLKTTNDKEVRSVEIKNPNLDKKSVEDKYSILDILAYTDDNQIINIEMQVTNRHDMIERTVFYLSQLLDRQVRKSDDYRIINRTVCINFLDFDLFDNDIFHNIFNFRNQNGEILTKLAEIHFIELKKLKKIINNDIIIANDEQMLINWGNFLNEPESEEVKMLYGEYTEFKDASKLLEFFNFPKRLRERYENRQKARWEKNSFLNEVKRTQEEIRKAQEEVRKSQEKVLNAQEEIRKEQEKVRKEQEKTRKAQEKTRKAQEKAQKAQKKVRKAQEKARKSQEKGIAIGEEMGIMQIAKKMKEKGRSYQEITEITGLSEEKINKL